MKSICMRISTIIQIRKIVHQRKVDGVIRINSDNHELLEWLDRKGYTYSVLDSNRLFISFANAQKGSALKKQYKVRQLQYIDLVGMIERQKDKKCKSIYIPSTSMNILPDVVKVLCKIGYRVSKYECVNNDVKFDIFEIKWR